MSHELATIVARTIMTGMALFFLFDVFDFTTGKAANGIMLDVLVNPTEEEKEHWINKYFK